MRRISLALALVGAVAVTGCSGGNKPAANTDSGVQKGVAGQYFFVNLFTPPVGGVISSVTSPSPINCGASAVTTTDANGQPLATPVFTWATSTSNVCGQVQVPWAGSVVVQATALTGFTFVGWAGDCTGSAATCTLTAGSDKTVVAIFSNGTVIGHTNFTDGAIHGPAYYAFVAGTAGHLECTTCHGPALAGQGIAPSCAACHPNPGPTPPPAGTAFKANKKTGLVATILQSSIITTPATPVTVRFSLKDNAGANVDVTGLDGKNLPMPVTMALVNFGIDANSNVQSFKNQTGGNPATVTAFNSFTSNSITNVNGTTQPAIPNANTPWYPDGQITKAGVACTVAAPCTCSATAPCVFLGTVGSQGTRACTTAAPCTCTAAAPCAQLLPTTNGSASLTRDAATGVYTYTFPTTVVFPTAAPYNTNTHEVWLATFRRENVAAYTDGNAYTAVNTSIAFNPVTGADAGTRQIVANSGCVACHDGFQPKGVYPNPATIGTADFHSSARVNGNYCNICHYDARGTPAGLAEARSFIHRIHAYEQLGMPTTAMYQGVSATYPQDVRNCATCHPNTAQGNQWKTHPTTAACISCHYATTFVPPVTHGGGQFLADGTTQIADANCNTCHTSADIVANHQPIQAKADSGSADTVAGPGVTLPAGASTITYDISSVSLAFDNAISTTGFRPQISFRIVKDGTAVDFGDYNGISTSEPITGFTGGPDIYLAWAQPQDGISAPADFNARTNASVKTIWQTPASYTLTRDASGYYTAVFKAVVVPFSATMLTGGIGFSALIQTDLAAYPYNALAPSGTPKGGFLNPAQAKTKAATGFTARRVTVDNAKCTSCHAQLGVEPTFHGGTRNDAVSCNFCHNPNRTSSGWSANSATFIHAIHGATKRSVPFNWVASCATGSTWDNTAKVCKDAGGIVTAPSIYYPGVEYPGTLSNCSGCHVAGGFDYSAPASAAAVPNLLYSTVATGTFTTTPAKLMSNSPYVTADGVTSYGAGFSVAVATGVATPATSLTLVSSPIASACFSCHDTAAARTHMVNDGGGTIYGARGAGFVARQEACLSCHGAGRSWDVNEVHWVK